MDVVKAVELRRDTAAFEPEGLVLSREEIEDLIAQACNVPSEFDLQPWRFVVVRDRERRQVLFECTRGDERVRDATAVVIVCGDTAGWEDAERAVRDRAARGLAVPGGADRAIEDIRRGYEGDTWKQALLALRGPSFAAMTLMLLAAERGIATAPIFDFSDETVKREFHIPGRFVQVVLVALGMPSTDARQPAPASRKPVKDIVFHEDMAGMPAVDTLGPDPVEGGR